MARDEAAPAEQRLHEPEKHPAHAVLTGEQPAQPVGVPERIGQVLHGDVLAVGFQQTGVQQRRDVGQLLPCGQGADVIDGNQRRAGVLGVERRVERDLEIAVPALARVGLAGRAHGTDERMHDGIRGVVAQKAERVLDLRAGLDVGAKTAQERAGLFLVHAAAEAGQVIAALGALFPDFKAEKTVRAVGTRRKRRRALNFVVDGFRSFSCSAHMGIAFRHVGSPFVSA